MSAHPDLISEREALCAAVDRQSRVLYEAPLSQSVFRPSQAQPTIERYSIIWP